MLCVVALFFNNNCPRIHELKQTHKNKYQVIFYIRLYLKTRLKFYYYYYYYYWLKLW
jgi:hypothetical protein